MVHLNKVDKLKALAYAVAVEFGEGSFLHTNEWHRLIMETQGVERMETCSRKLATMEALGLIEWNRNKGARVVVPLPSGVQEAHTLAF